MAQQPQGMTLPIFVEIGNWPLDIRTVPGGVNQKGRSYQAFEVRRQLAAIHFPGQPPRELKIRLGKDQVPWQAGRYALGVGSFYVDNGELHVKQQLELVPVAAAAPAAGAQRSA